MVVVNFLERAMIKYLSITVSMLLSGTVYANLIQCPNQPTQAVSPTTGNVVIFPTPCDVPRGWSSVQPAELSLNCLQQYWAVSKHKVDQARQQDSKDVMENMKSMWNSGIDRVERSQTWQNLKKEGESIGDQSQQGVDKAKAWIEDGKQSVIKWLER